MLSQEFEIQDLMSYDPSVTSSLTYIRNTMIRSTDISMNFTLQDKENGNVELISGGTTVGVNNYNKHAYIRLFIEYYGYHKTHQQVDAFLKGLYEVIPAKTLNMLTLDDLQKLLQGTTTIDLNDWKAHTRYIGEGANSDNSLIKCFWDTLATLTDSQLRKFLQFCTGCKSVPIEGFRSLKNNRQEE